MPGSDFAEALAAARAGQEWGFAALYEAFAPAVLGFLRGRIPSEAEDVAATVWLEAARSLERFDGDEAGFRAWIFTIARRRMMNERRRQARRPLDLHPPETLPTPVDRADPAAQVADTDAAAVAIDTIRAVLPELQGEVVLLRVVAELDVNEIAALLHLTPGHVRVLAHRGLRALAEHFSPVPVTPGVDPGISEVP